MNTKLTILAKRLALFGLQAMMLAFLAQGMAYATGGTPSGSGTEGDPFLIADYEDLKVVGTDSLTYSLNSVYRLAADIDASPSDTANGGSGFVPIGTYDTPFTGAFHGGGYVIKNLTINLPATDSVGLFSFAEATIDSLCVRDISIIGHGSVGGLIGQSRSAIVNYCYTTGAVMGNSDNVGGLIGFNCLSTISNCYTTCSVSGNSNIGGLAGNNTPFAVIINCHATGKVIGNGDYVGGLIGYSYWSEASYCYSTGSVTGNNDVGGLMGYNYFYSAVSNCYATGTVMGTGNVGGLVGENYATTVNYCYATGAVTGSGTNAGGIVGFNNFHSTINSSCATGTVMGSSGSAGGLTGYNRSDGIVSSCYWNTETTELSNGIGYNEGTATIIGLTTAQMKIASNFSGWIFDTTWVIIPDSTYPGLQGLDNAPFAFYDTLVSNRTFALSRLLLNDCDVETARNNLILHVTYNSVGTTDSVNTLTFDVGITNGTVDTIKYRVGEVRSTDTLWGNIAKAYITLDTTFMGVENKDNTSTTILFLGQNRPNPFKYNTVINYQLPFAGHVNLKLYDMLGRNVATLVDGLKPAGVHSANFNAAKLAGGVYFYRLQAGTLTETRKLLLLK